MVAMENIHKICTKCKTEKPLTAFHRDSSKKDGHRPICKVCTNENRRKNEKKEDVPDNHKKCNCCESIKPLTAFYKSGNSVRYICMECDNEKRSESYQKEHGKNKSTKDRGKLALALTAVAQMMTQKKVCHSCQEEKDLEDFRSRNRNIDGLSNKCKSCFRREKEVVPEENAEDLQFIKELEARQKHFENLVKRKKSK